MARGYTTPLDVAAYLGTTFNRDQAVMVNTRIGQAEDFIDQIVRRGDSQSGTGGWLNGPITNEQYDLTNVGARIYLRDVPVASVQSVTIRSHQVGDVGTILVAGTDYELQDPLAGLIVFSASYGTSTYGGYAGAAGYNQAGRLIGTGFSLGSFAKVSYTPSQPVPGDIQMATMQLVAHWIQYNINPQRYGIGATKTGAQTITLSQNGVLVFPPETMKLIMNNVRLLV